MRSCTAEMIRDISIWIAAGLLLAVLTGCDSRMPAVGGGKRLPDTFTFFDVDANSTDSESLRRTLGEHLGREAVAGKDSLDLAVFSDISLDSVFPALGDLNGRLNPDPRARTEHAITSLTYRYPQKHYPTFTYARLIFSALHRHPLMITIDANSEAGTIIETLSSKYGPPLLTRPEGLEATLWSWEKKGDWLIVQKRQNKFGTPEYIIAIFYVERIRELLAAEAGKSPGAAPGKNSAF